MKAVFRYPFARSSINHGLYVYTLADLRGRSRLALSLLMMLACLTLGCQDKASRGMPHFRSVESSDTRVNHEGRLLPSLPKIAAPILFHTPEADAVLAAMQIMPKNSPWNEDISQRPVHVDSERIIRRIGEALPLGVNPDMNFVIVPPDQPKIPVKITAYPEESDTGPYPIPENTPIEHWPLEGSSLTALQNSEPVTKIGSRDRHALVVDPVNGKIYEFWQTYRRAGGWEASAQATFDLNSNQLRPLGWTSSDAAGLPIFPAIVRYDELERGMVEHAMRFTVKQTRREFIYPATHFASKLTDQDLPAMGQRLRLKASTDLSGLSRHALALAKGLQKYGMLVADNGDDWLISVAPDPRIHGLGDLSRFRGKDFEVIVSSAENEGPRAAQSIR
jgi:hypothetical protein